MSYISAIKQQDQILVWERTDKGRAIKKFPAPYYFYTEDENGKYTSIFGKKLKREDFNNSTEFFNKRTQKRAERKLMYESDIAPEVKVLQNNYYNHEPPKLHVTFLDIEVDYNPTVGFSSVANPYAAITAISLQHYWSGKSIVFVVPPPDWDRSTFDQSLQDLAEVIFCENEKELLLNFLAEIEDSDLLSGWNSDFFDVPYICKRLEKVVGRGYMRQMSFDGAEMPKFRDVETQFGVNKDGVKLIQTTVDLSGRISVDYMALFIKYEMDKRPSYKLESIAEEILPHMLKLEFEGSLYKLYRRDFNKFIRYNIRDCEILKGFEDKLGYVNLANVMVHTSCALFKHVLGTLALSDLAIVNYCHYERDVRVPDWSEKTDGNIKGACVLFPQVGMHKKTGSIDVKSLYPSDIIGINISPETLIGQFTDNIKAWMEIAKGSSVNLLFEYDDEHSAEMTALEWRNLLKERKWAISGYGTVFDQNKRGIIPSLLATWFAKRKEYQKLKEQALEQATKYKGVNEKKYEEWNDKFIYFDKLQYVYKIKLNSTYGALTNYYFRFFDLRMGESVTGTGRAILKHQCRKVAEILDGNYHVDFPLYDTIKDALSKGGLPEEALEGPIFKGYFQSPSVVYGDTDSCYFDTGADTQEEATTVANYVAKKVNESFPSFMRETFLCTEGYDKSISASREVVTGKGIFVGKKRYVLHIVDLDGKPVDKFKIMGLDIKKTTIPKAIAKVLLSFVEDILRSEHEDDLNTRIVTYKEELRKPTNILNVGLPKGVNGVEDYTQQFKINGIDQRLPGHVAAAIHYNQCLDEYGDLESPRITSSMKIKVFYLTSKHGKFKSIALPTDIDVIPQWFIDHFLPEVDFDAHIERLVDNPLENIFTAINKKVPTKQELFLDSLFVY